MRIRIANGLVAGALLAVGAAHRNTHVVFIAHSTAYANAARSYEAIWAEYGDRIVASFEARTCLRFSEPEVAAVIADEVSNSGGPKGPMRLRATYPSAMKRSTLVHELGHRHLWQLAERLDSVDGHRTLDLVLDRVWADVWGERFAADAIRHESEWDADYDYAAAWSWQRSLSRQERARLWNLLLTLNGFPGGCDGLRRAS